MATSQEANLFIPAALGKLGFRRISDIIQKRKRAIVGRLYESPMELRVAVTARPGRGDWEELGPLGHEPARVRVVGWANLVATGHSEAAVWVHLRQQAGPCAGR